MRRKEKYTRGTGNGKASEVTAFPITHSRELAHTEPGCAMGKL